MNSLVSVLIAAGSLAGTGLLALVTLVGKRGEVAVDAQTSLTSGQLAFVNLLSEREARLQKRIDHQDVEIERLRRRCSALEFIIRGQGLPLPDDI